MKLENKNLEFACGLDEVGRGCLAGPVVAAAVVFEPDFVNAEITDSKKLSPKKRKELAEFIKEKSLCYSIQSVSVEEIDKINILQASIKAMHLCIDALKHKPTHLLVDGHYFHPYDKIPHECIIKGDSKILSIGAASILAKVFRDDLMIQLHEEYPVYGWDKNKGYPTKHHRNALKENGSTPWHRNSFRLFPDSDAISFE